MVSRARQLSTLFSPSKDTAAGVPQVLDTSGLVDSDYILNRIEGSIGDIKGSVIGSNIDLSTGNFFEVTANNQTLSFSSSPVVKEFKIKLIGDGEITGFDLSNASYDNVSLSTSGQEIYPEGITFNLLGTKMYVAGRQNGVHQYTLSTAFDLSTATHDSSLSLSELSDGGIGGVAISTDGTKMFICGYVNDFIYQYTLSTAFDLSTATYDNVTFSTINENSTVDGLIFKSDGTKMYIVGRGSPSDEVYQYTLSTPFDISTASYDNKKIAVVGTTPKDLYLTPEGNKLYVIEESNDSVYQYTLSTPFDISTASYDNIFYSVLNEGSNPFGLFFNPEGTKLFTVDGNSDAVFQYSTGSVSLKGINYPASVKFPNGSPPDNPDVGKVDTIEFYTTDAGTTYYAYRLANNQS